MKAMIFAAGLGTRLKPLTDRMPKALVPVCGKPLLEHILVKLAAAGFDDVVINVHHFADMIEHWCQNHPIEGIRCIHFSDERQELLETGGGIRHAAPYLDECGCFLIHNVDILSNVDLRAFYQQSADNDATLLVSQRKTKRYLLFDKTMHLVGWTNIETGEVKSPYPSIKALQGRLNEEVLEDEELSMFAFSGIHCVSSRLLPMMEAWPERFPIMDFYLHSCASINIRGIVKPDLRLMDVGKLDTLSEAETFLRKLNINN